MVENPWKNNGNTIGKSHGKSMDNKNGKKEMFPWYSLVDRTNDDFGRLSRFPENIFLFGVNFQNDFSPKAVQSEASGV